MINTLIKQCCVCIGNCLRLSSEAPFLQLFTTCVRDNFLICVMGRHHPLGQGCWENKVVTQSLFSSRRYNTHHLQLEWCRLILVHMFSPSTVHGLQGRMARYRENSARVKAARKRQVKGGLGEGDTLQVPLPQRPISFAQILPPNKKATTPHPSLNHFPISPPKNILESI